MSGAYLLVIAVLFGVGAYLLMHRSLTRIILGIITIANGVNVLIVGTGSRTGAPPIVGADAEIADPVPQAFVLTAIVIGFALVSFVLALAWRSWTLTGDDEVEDDLEDAGIAARPDAGEVGS